MGDARRPDRARAVGLFVVAATLFAAGLGLRDPWPPDEPRFALVVRGMIETGDWLFPQVAGFLYSDKPPLFFWAMAVAAEAFGLRVAFLLPSLVAALGVTALVYDLAHRLWGARAAFLAAAALVLTVQFTVQARFAQIDMFLCLWVTLAMYAFARHLVLGPAWRWWYVGWAAVALGIMSKGVGILAAFVLLPYAVARVAGWAHVARPVGAWRWAAGPLVMLAVLALWLGPVLHAVGDDPALAAYRDDLLFRQTAVRYADAWTHHRPVWYFAAVVAWAWLPLAALIPWLVPAWARGLRQRDGRLLLLLGWIALVLVFFTLSPGKRDVYILPALPMLAAAAAPALPALLARRDVRTTAWALCAALVAASLALVAWFTLAHPDDGAALAARHGPAVWPVLVGLAACAVPWLALGTRRGTAALAGAAVSVWLAWGWWGMPMFNDARTPVAMLARVHALVPAEHELALVGWKEQLVLFAPRPVKLFGFRREPSGEAADAVAWRATQPGRRWLLVPAGALPALGIDAADAVIDVGDAHRVSWRLVGPASRARAPAAETRRAAGDAADRA